jgi:predicted porin
MNQHEMNRTQHFVCSRRHNALHLALVIIAGLTVAVTNVSFAQSDDSVTSAASAVGAVSLYGRVDLAIDHVVMGANSNVGYGTKGATLNKMGDNTSRVGLVGAESLGGGTRALYGFEFGFNGDDGAFATATAPMRYAFVGLAGSWGTLNMGRLDSSTPAGSPLYSQLARTVRWIVHDAGPVAIGTRILNGNNRVSNAVAYRSPDVGGVNLALRVNQAGPDGAQNPSTNPRVVTEDDLRQFQAALNGKWGVFSTGIGFGYDKKNGGFLVNDFRNKVQAVASYDLGVARPYVVWGQDRYNGTATTRSSVNWWLVGMTAPMGAFSATLNYMERDVQADRLGKLKKMQGDVSYYLSKRTSTYLYFDRDTTNSNRADSVAKAVGLGILHRF